MAFPTVHAAAISVTNAGFETDILADGGFQMVVSGWTATEAGVFNPTATEFPGGIPEGVNVAFAGPPQIASTGILTQTLATTFQDGLIYQLSVDAGDRTDLSLPTFRIGLWADGVLVSDGGLILSAADGTLPTDGGWSTFNAQVQADPAIDGKAIEIRLEAFLLDPPLVLDPDRPDVQISFDNVQLQVVPVPAAVWLFGSALGLLGWMNRRAR